MQKNVIILDNQYLTHKGIISILHEVAPETEISEVATKSQLTNKLRKGATAYVVLDYQGSDIIGTETLLRLAGQYEKVQWLIVSNEVPESMIHKLSTNPSFGFVLKNSNYGELCNALMSLLSRERYICQKLLNLLLATQTSSRKAINELTTSELDVLRLIALGKTVKEIAAARFSSVHTITTHKRSIFRKLGVSTIHDATKVALQNGIVDLVEYFI